MFPITSDPVSRTRKPEPVPGRYPVRFGTAELVRDTARGNAWLVSVDGVAQSYVDLDDPAHLEFDYVRRFADVVDRLPPGPLDALAIGGAACTLRGTSRRRDRGPASWCSTPTASWWSWSARSWGCGCRGCASG